jgi:hypothetical protein
MGKTATQQHARFVLVLGDMLGHHYRDNYENFAGDHSQAGYQAFVKKTMQYLTAEIVQTFPATNVYMTVGNNDSYVKDNVAKPRGAFFQDMAMLWSGLIKDAPNQKSMRATFPAAGYYAVYPDPRIRLRLIVLNTILFAPDAQTQEVAQAAQAELDWLQRELVSARENHEKVLLAFHIPAGIDVFYTIKSQPTIVENWLPVYTARFEQEAQQFSDILTGVLVGHVHMDWFAVLKFPHDAVPVMGVPAISPLYGNNPAYQVFQYTSFGALRNALTFVLPLAAAPFTWQQEYNFNAVYQPACHGCRISNAIQGLSKTGAWINAYKNYYASGTVSQPISQTENWQYYWCQTQAISLGDYEACMSGG